MPKCFILRGYLITSYCIWWLLMFYYIDTFCHHPCKFYFYLCLFQQNNYRRNGTFHKIINTWTKDLVSKETFCICKIWHEWVVHTVFPFVTNRIISYVVYLHWAKNASLYKYTVNLSVNLWVSFISKTNSLPFLCRNTGGRLICQTDSNIYGNLSQHKTVSKCTLELYKLINLNKRTPKTSAHSQHAVILENTAQAQFTES